jgi:hypothetical protein
MTRPHAANVISHGPATVGALCDAVLVGLINGDRDVPYGDSFGSDATWRYCQDC